MLLLGTVFLLLSIPIVIVIFIWWILNFRIHIYVTIIETYHYNRIQEVPLSVISSDFKGESFINGLNKAYFGFFSDNQKTEWKNSIKEIVDKQLGGVRGWNLAIEDIPIGFEEGCRVMAAEKVRHPVYYVKCKCSDECGERKGVIVDVVHRASDCFKPENLAKCLGIWNINVTFFSETYFVPLAFNGSAFSTTMRFNAYG